MPDQVRIFRTTRSFRTPAPSDSRVKALLGTTQTGLWGRENTSVAHSRMPKEEIITTLGHIQMFPLSTERKATRLLVTTNKNPKISI